MTKPSRPVLSVKPAQLPADLRPSPCPKMLAEAVRRAAYQRFEARPA